jgi:hypothetical protein
LSASASIVDDCIVAFACVASATDYTWIGPSSCSSPPCGGDWTNSAYWSPNGVPGSGDTATINGASDPNTTGITSATATVAKLTVTGNTELPDCILTIKAGGTFKWTGGSKASIGGKLTISAGASGTLDGDLELAGGELETPERSTGRRACSPATTARSSGTRAR